ncbi:hypothetical protein ACFQVC_03110 [Streptomyces monticola]|uniref:Flp pilus-assembly TadG-like N-terminal domain-containing protein n=1 Tax=Streptomyces monticola TaxID=2666263 RepID=A0ABW2JB58_9ACTN
MSTEREIPQVRGTWHDRLTCGCLVALIAALCLVGVVFGVIVFQSGAAEREALEGLQASVADARDRLRSAAGDGALTDKEVREVLRMSQASERGTVRATNTVTIKALVHGTHASAVGGGEVSHCRAFRVTFSAEGATVSDRAAEGCNATPTTGSVSP